MQDSPHPTQHPTLAREELMALYDSAERSAAREAALEHRKLALTLGLSVVIGIATVAGMASGLTEGAKMVLLTGPAAMVALALYGRSVTKELARRELGAQSMRIKIGYLLGINGAPMAAGRSDVPWAGESLVPQGHDNHFGDVARAGTGSSQWATAKNRTGMGRARDHLFLALHAIAGVLALAILLLYAPL